MTVTDDARRLVDTSPYYHDGGFKWCGFCDAHEPDHKPDCPWLNMPKIVAVLEAVDRTISAYDKPDDRRTFWLEFWALEALMRDESR